MSRRRGEYGAMFHNAQALIHLSAAHGCAPTEAGVAPEHQVIDIIWGDGAQGMVHVVAFDDCFSISRGYTHLTYIPFTPGEPELAPRLCLNAVLHLLHNESLLSPRL